MYQIFGMEIVDTNEIKEQIEKNINLKIKEDITKGTQRDDAIGYRAVTNQETLGYDSNEITDEDTMNKLMEDTDKYIKENLEKILPKVQKAEVYSYTYDPVTKEIYSIIVIMHISNAERKLRDVLKRLLRI